MRYTRHELKQDKFAEGAAEAVQEVVEHRAGIMRAAIIVAVVVAIAGGVFWYLTSSEQKAAGALSQALVTYNAPVLPPGAPKEEGTISFSSAQERELASKKAFYEVSDHYGWTRAGQYARYLAGITELELGNTKVAEDQLRALSNTRRRDLAGLAKYALAAAYRDEKRDADAVSLLQGLIDKPTTTVPKATAQLALAELYSSAHQNDKAKIIYEQIAKENPKGVLSEIAKAHEEALK